MLPLVFGCLLPAFCLSLTLTTLVRKYAPRWNLVDQPAARKVHRTPTPLGGGIGVWAGVVIPLAVVTFLAFATTPESSLLRLLPDSLVELLPGVRSRAAELWTLLGAATVLAAMGLIDDFKNLPWKPRLAIQLGVALVLVYGANIQATVFAPQPWIGQLVSIGWILVLVNALNFLDNMDGLTGGIGLVASILLAMVMLSATAEPRWMVAGVLLLLAGSILGFLVHNWPPASIFMGDSGSYFIGCLLACLVIRGTFYDDSVTGRHVMLTPLFILAVPLYDFASVMLIRLREGRSPFHPDKSHFSHRLVELGLKPARAVLTIHLATLTTGLGALLLYAVPDWSQAMIVLGLVGCVLWIVAILETAGRRSQRELREAHEEQTPGEA